MNNAIKDFLKTFVMCAVMGVFVVVGLSATLEDRFAAIENRIGFIEEPIDSTENRLEKMEIFWLKRLPEPKENLIHA